MRTWLIDTAIFNTLATPKAASLQKWFEANSASFFLSTASLVEIGASVAKLSAKAPARGGALQAWFDGFTTQFADRIHSVDSEIAMRADALLPSLQSGLPRHRHHDAVLVATAQMHGHGLLTRRVAVFGPWTMVPTAEP
jgi:predicted nucleic acid-binding protein